MKTTILALVATLIIESKAHAEVYVIKGSETNHDRNITSKPIRRSGYIQSAPWDWGGSGMLDVIAARQLQLIQSIQARQAATIRARAKCYGR